MDNVNQWNESVAMDAFFCNTPAQDDDILGHAGVAMPQLCASKTSSRTLRVYPMYVESDMSGTLKHCVPKSLLSNNARAQCGKCVFELLHLCVINDFQSEPHNQYQNFAECKIGDLLVSLWSQYSVTRFDLELLHFSPDKLLVLTSIHIMDNESKFQATVAQKIFCRQHCCQPSKDLVPC
jgi:hypothetical protein